MSIESRIELLKLRSEVQAAIHAMDAAKTSSEALKALEQTVLVQAKIIHLQTTLINSMGALLNVDERSSTAPYSTPGLQ